MNYQVGQRRLNSLDRVDQLPGDLRECVHEFGLPIVECLVKHGIKRPSAIREVVKEIWGGARQEGQKGSAYNTLEWLLMQSGSGMSAAKFRRFLADNNLAIVPTSPTAKMVTASMGEVSGFNIRCTREEKHKRRLIAAIRAAVP